MRRSVFITGGTGYIGRGLIPELLAHGHEVRALVRAGAEGRLPRGASAILGDALQHASYAAQVRPADTFVHLVGVSHPSPAKAALFREALIRQSGLNATILRPWYVLGPGHRWPIVLLPLYWVFGRLPASRESNVSSLMNAPAFTSQIRPTSGCARSTGLSHAICDSLAHPPTSRRRSTDKRE